MSFWQTVVAAAVGGLMLGLGLVFGSFAVRLVRRYMDEDKEK